MLATDGGLLFTGKLTGEVIALDIENGKRLWQFQTGSSINAPPISYSVNGKQYIAVLVGSRQSINVLQNAPELKNTATASMLYVFGL